ncbi:KUP/HAK/KT family potassium transporter, partial [Paraburkholderia unamae]|uniref:KUP/HAK/KT family potassium transporter n=1 Tax=Paraburkholderia unamae TaxID=219649 RepID=UPI003FD8F2F0
WRCWSATYRIFLARDTVVATAESCLMPPWRERLFAFLTKNSAHTIEYYSLPANRVIEMGGQISI